MTTRPWSPLSGRARDATFNAMQNRVDEACEALWAVIQPGAVWTCGCCDVATARPEWMPASRLRDMADAHYQAERGTRFQGLSGATWSLGISHLQSQGVLERHPRDYTLRLAPGLGDQRERGA